MSNGLLKSAQALDDSCTVAWPTPAQADAPVQAPPIAAALEPQPQFWPSTLVRPQLAKHARLVGWLGTLAGLGCVVGMVYRAGPGRILSTCAQAGWGLTWIVLAPVLGTVLHMAAWWVLLPPVARPSWADATKRYVASQAWNELGFSVLGEPLKAWGMPEEAKTHAVTALVLDNAAKFMATLAFLAAGAFYLQRFLRQGQAAQQGLLLACGAVAVFSVLMLLARWTKPRSQKAQNSAQSSLSDKLSQLLGALGKSLRQSPQRLLASFALHVGGKVWMVVEVAIALAVLGPAQVKAAPVLAFGSALGSMLGAAVPAQVGAVESMMSAVGVSVGVPLVLTASVALVRRIRTVLWIVVGLIWAKQIVSGSKA